MRRIAIVVLSSAFFGLAGAALAATDGDLGSTSTGSLDISVTIPSLVRISHLDDIDLGTFDGSGLSGGDDVCIYSNNGGYSITATSEGGDFVLIGTDVEDELAYTVRWANAAGASSGSTLTHGTPHTVEGGTFTTPSCRGGSDLNARVLIDVEDSALEAVSADSYSGTLTLMVEPQ